MPIFEYKCKQCGHVTEVLQKSSRPGKHACEKCGSADLQKLLSGFAVGRGKSPTPCESCPSGPCHNDTCGGRMCGMA